MKMKNHLCLISIFFTASVFSLSFNFVSGYELLMNPMSTIKGLTLNSAVHLNIINKHFLQNVTDHQLFCVDIHSKAIEKIWSIASVC